MNKKILISVFVLLSLISVGSVLAGNTSINYVGLKVPLVKDVQELSEENLILKAELCLFKKFSWCPE